jgi:hypothetical protein
MGNDDLSERGAGVERYTPSFLTSSL